MKKLLAFLAALFILTGFQLASAGAAPWDKLPPNERGVYTTVFLCALTTKTVREALKWPLLKIKKNPRKTGKSLFKAVRWKSGSPLGIGYDYQVTKRGKKIVQLGKMYVGKNATRFFDYYVVRAIRSGKYDYRKNPQSVLKFATGKYFCYEPLRVM